VLIICNFFVEGVVDHKYQNLDMKRKIDAQQVEGDETDVSDLQAAEPFAKRQRTDHGSSSRGKKSMSMADNYRFEDDLDEDEDALHNIDDDMNDRQERRRVLKEVWNEVAISLRKLEVYIQDRKISKKPWDHDEYIKMFT
jgi:hypothetical protein